MSNLRPDTRQNSVDNVFQGISVKKEEVSYFAQFLNEHDFSPNTVRAMKQDLCKFAGWFSVNNGEVFDSKRVTTRDAIDFRNHLQREKQQAVATINRCLVSIRRYFQWLVEKTYLEFNVVKSVKELKRQILSPKGLSQPEVRRLLRELELRQDVRGMAVFSILLYTGSRCGDLVNLNLQDVMISERSGTVTFRRGKGNKQRTVPLPLPARKALQDWLEVRPPVQPDNVFVGERGPLTESGTRNLCDKYSAICGFKIHPHLLRHTMAHKFLEDNGNDLVSLAQILGHENLNTTKRYVQRTEEQLGEAADRMSY